MLFLVCDCLEEKLGYLKKLLNLTSDASHTKVAFEAAKGFVDGNETNNVFPYAYESKRGSVQPESNGCWYTGGG